jgi:hypothetical protein
MVLFLQGSFEQTGTEGRGCDTVLFGVRIRNHQIGREIPVDHDRFGGNGGVKLLPRRVGFEHKAGAGRIRFRIRDRHRLLAGNPA